jgi:hypothetical protein
MRWKCPACGNTNKDRMTTNSFQPSHPDLSVLCLKRCAAEDSTLGAEYWEENPDTQPVCGNEWHPNWDQGDEEEEQSSDPWVLKW